MEDCRSGDRLRAVILDQSFELAGAGIPRAGLLVLDRVRAFNKAAGREDELMEQRTVEACLQAEKLACCSKTPKVSAIPTLYVVSVNVKMWRAASPIHRRGGAIFGAPIGGNHFRLCARRANAASDAIF